PGDVGAAPGVHRDAVSSVVAAVTSHGAAAQEGGVCPGGARSVHFGHEGVVAPTHVVRLEGVDGGEPYGVGAAGEVGVARGVHRDGAAALVIDLGAAQVGGIDRRAAVGGQPGHEDIPRAPQHGLVGTGQREVGRAGGAHDIYIARGVHPDTVAHVSAA